MNTANPLLILLGINLLLTLALVVYFISTKKLIKNLSSRTSQTHSFINVPELKPLLIHVTKSYLMSLSSHMLHPMFLSPDRALLQCRIYTDYVALFHRYSTNSGYIPTLLSQHHAPIKGVLSSFFKRMCVLRDKLVDLPSDQDSPFILVDGLVSSHTNILADLIFGFSTRF